MLNSISTSRERMPGSERVSVIARWLANQRAIPTSMTEPTAWQLLEEGRNGGLELEGPKAPLIVQPRFSLWLVGQLGGRPLMHVFANEEGATAKAQQIGAEMKVPVLLIDRGGDIVSRFDPPQPAAASVMPPANPPPVPTAVARPPTPAPQAAAAAPAAKLAEVRPAPEVKIEAPRPAPEVKVEAPAPEVKVEAPKPMPEVKVEAPRPAPEAPAVKAEQPRPEVEAPAALKSVVLKVERHEGRWGVFYEGRVIATAPTRDKARHRAKILKADPDFVQDPRPMPEE